jgi:tetratricopeptide (TPR) repeat protein
MERSLVLREIRGTEVLPIILKPLPWFLEPISHLQLLQVPAEGWSRQEFLTEIVRKLHQLAIRKTSSTEVDPVGFSPALNEEAIVRTEFGEAAETGESVSSGKEFGLHETDDLDLALLSLEQSLALAEGSPGLPQPQVAVLLNRLSLVLSELGRPRAAIERIKAAVEIWRASARHRVGELAVLVGNLGLAHQDMGDLHTAREFLERALILAETAHSTSHRDLVPRLIGLAGVLFDEGDAVGALDRIREAFTILASDDRIDHPVLARAMVLEGHSLRALGRYAEARERFRKALASKVRGRDQWPHFASAHTGLAILALGEGHLAEALHHLEEAMDINERSYGPAHPSVAADCWNLGVVLREQGLEQKAKGSFQRSLDILSRLPEGEHPRAALVRAQLEALAA